MNWISCAMGLVAGFGLGGAFVYAEWARDLRKRKAELDAEVERLEYERIAQFALLGQCPPGVPE